MSKNRIHIILPLFFLCLSTLVATSQPIVTATANRRGIRTGEPIRLTLSATWQGKDSFNTGFIIPDSLPHFDIWEKMPPSAIQNGFEQTLVVTSYDSGVFAIPRFKLDVDDATLPAERLFTDSIPIQVMPVNVDTLTEYHDIKDIMEVPPVKQWPFILGIVLASLVAIVGLYYLLKKTGITKSGTKRWAGETPFQAATKALEALEKSISSTLPNSKQFFTQLTAIHRTYVQDAYGFRSYEQTGDEMIMQAKPLLDTGLFYAFANAIRLGDAAKFAKYDPPKEEWTAGVGTFRDTITALDKRQQTPSITPQTTPAS